MSNCYNLQFFGLSHLAWDLNTMYRNNQVSTVKQYIVATVLPFFYLHAAHSVPLQTAFLLVFLFVLDSNRLHNQWQCNCAFYANV